MVRKAAKKSLLDYKSFLFSVLKIIVFEVINDSTKDLWTDPTRVNILRQRELQNADEGDFGKVLRNLMVQQL